MSFVDTDLARGVDAPKTSPEEIVKRALDALESGFEEVLADEPARLLKAGLSAPRPSYLPQRLDAALIGHLQQPADQQEEMRHV